MKKRTKFLLIIIILAAIVALINVLSGGDKSTTPSDNQTPAVISGEGKKADIWVADEFNPPVNLGAPINTLKWEDGPSISPDGNTLYFTIGRDRYVDSYFSQKVNGKWSNPQPHSFNLEDFPDGAVHTQDNKILYLASIRPGGIGVLGDIYLFENNQLTNLGAPVNTESMESEPYISPDGNTLYFGSDRPGGEGDLDIWFSQKSATGWGEPINLGEPVNTKGQETQPFVTADGKELYFMATNRDGVGGPAIFRSIKSGEGWSEPQVIASGFVGEPTLTADKKYLYFVHLFLAGGDLTDADIYVAERK